MIDAPLQNIEIGVTIILRFSHHTRDIFTHQRDNDFWRAFAEHNVFYGYGFHFYLLHAVLPQSIRW
jgi:hypothetical protein